MEQQQNNDNYKKSLKATSLFGGLQIFKIIISIINAKFVAVLLGTSGMGIFGLLSSTTSLISSATSFGLGTSAVRDIAAANKTGDSERISLVIGVFRHLVWITGLLGLLICFIFAPTLSVWSFGNEDYSLAFRLLSITLLLNQISSGQGALLQGMMAYKYMVKSSIIGSILGLCVSIPLYYKWGKEAIVPVIIISSLTGLLLTWYFSSKIKISKKNITIKDIRHEGKTMFNIGFMLSVSAFVSILFSYIIRIFISNIGNIDDVGLFSAGFAIINQSVGLVFTAMGTDYYPRLSASANDNAEFNSVINQQAEISLLLIGPIIVAFIVFIKPIVVLLYSTKFAPIEVMIYWAIFATIFKALSWCVAFSFLAKGDSKQYLYNEIPANIYGLLFNILFYYLYGLTGLGISFLIIYLIYLIQVLIVCNKKYQVKVKKNVFKILWIHLVIALCCILLVLYGNKILLYCCGSLLLCISIVYSYKELNKKINISQIIKKRLNK